ncbi:hypothetical protein AAVH_08740 [Aphelenchoides avenae]|nr:hypothetical protein AAVH_08740 [Aphelenchus avenae]
MSSFFGQLALVDAALFTGAAVLIVIAEQPARLKLADSALLTEFQNSYPRGMNMQAPLAAIGAVLGLLSWFTHGSSWWFYGALFIVANWPFTLLAIMPINKQLMATSAQKVDSRVRGQIEQWGTLHAVRAGLGAAATLCFFFASLY